MEPSGPRQVGSPNAEPERLQKVLAHAGVGSRRACEEFILQGRITINGKIVRELGTRVVAGRDRVAIDGEPIHDERPAYIAVNKPKGYVSTNNDPSGRPRVVDLVPNIPQRVYTVGRLDEMSTGLMLLTNDGELANRLAHPKYGVEKVYRAVVAGTPSPEVYQKLVEGVWLAEGKVRAKRVKPIAHKGDATVLELVLAEGKNREVRRMLAKFGHKVMTLTRVAVGPVTLKGLKPGGWRFLTAREVDLLRQVADGRPVPTGRFGPDRPMRPPTRGPRARQMESGPQQASQRPRPGGGSDRPPVRGTAGLQDQNLPPRRPAVGASAPPRPRPSQSPGGGPPRPKTQGASGPPPTTRRPSAGSPSRRPAPTPPPPAPPVRRPPPEKTPTRRIIGLDIRVPEGPPPSRRPVPRKRPGLPPRRRPSGPADEE